MKKKTTKKKVFRVLYGFYAYQDVLAKSKADAYQSVFDMNEKFLLKQAELHIDKIKRI